MDFPTVSVIIPTYNGAKFIGEAIRSVLDQTYPNFEIIVVDDASPDDTAEVLKQFNDSRIKYLVHEKNLGARIARKTGICASSGEIIAFLDQDDLFHPQKLEAHVDYLTKHPDVGMSYNARFSFNTSPASIRDIWRPPQTLTLVDAVQGFPIAPSDMVFRRDWGIRTEYFEGDWDNSGGEIVLLGRMIFDGCRFGYVDRALNYRRFHPGRIFKDLSGSCESELKCLEIIFTDPRCPADVRALRNWALIITYGYFGCRALAQGETNLGQDYYRKSFQLVPSILEGNPSPAINYLVDFSVEDETQDHEALLKHIFSQLPQEMAHLSRQHDWAIANGYLMKGARAVMWNRAEDGRAYFRRAQQFGIEINESALQRLISLLLDYDVEFGEKAAQEILRKWVIYLEKSISQPNVRRLKGGYLLNRAFRSYHAGEYTTAPAKIMQAMLQNPAYLFTPGVIAVLLRSLVRAMRRRG